MAIAWVVTAAGAVLLTGAQAQTSSLKAAQDLFQQHHWAQAAAAFEAVEKAQPRQTDARMYLGKCYINLARYDDAAANIEAYLADHPQSDDAAYLIAYVRFRQDKPADSLRLYTAAARLKTPTSDDLKVVALDYVLLNDYDDAAHYLTVALQMDPSNLEARYHLGRVRYQQSQLDAAIAAFQEVLSADPTNVRAEDNLGLCLEGKNLVPQAIAAYRRAIGWDEADRTHNPEPYLDLGILLIKSDQPAEAVPLLARAAEIDPNSMRAHYQLAKAYLSLAKLAEAEHEAQEAVRVAPKNASAHYLLGRIYHHLKRPDLETREFSITQQLMNASRAHSSGMAGGTDNRQ
jgi:tetratricopeptide (TPR) repeat protein